ncbi:MAG: hypothetical protein K0R03_505 [Moraxellaceae bacterium]|jgi:hypothetical protein|nr:hypothetical protein [Moraxellaceae bacterium]
MLQVLKQSGFRPLAAAVLAAGSLAGAGQAWANTAAEATIRNTVTVNYADAAGTAQTAITAQVDVLVNLVRSSPLLSAPVDQTTDSATNAVYSYTITTTANGVASYNLGVSSLAQSAGISASTASTNVASVTLGATTVANSVIIAAAGTTSVTVPRDNTADGSINGLIVGDWVVIGGALFQISAVGADTNGVGTTTITVNGNGTALNAAAGTLIAERQSFTMTVDPGPVTGTGDQTVTVDTTATDAVNNTYTATDQTITTVRNVNLTVQKLVRNVTNPVVGGGTTATVGGNTYYGTGITGNPGDTLQYLIVVTNAVGAANATSVRISDPIPPFTTYTPGSMYVENGGTLSAALNDSANDGDAAEFGGTAVYFYLGAGGNDGGAGVNDGVGGTLTGTAPNNVSRAIFSVTIN